MKKRKLKRKLKLGKIIFLFIILFGIGFSLYYFNNKKDNPGNKEDNLSNKKIISSKEKTYNLSLAMVGDALINNNLYNSANKSANYDGYDFKPMLNHIKDIIKGYDLAYYNQETILGGSDIGLSSYPSFNSPYEVGDAMIDAGFNMVSLATNHTLDRGEKAVLNSSSYWEKQNTVMTAGSYSSLEKKEKINIMEKNNITYTMLNYTYGTNGIEVPSGKEYLVNIWPMDNNSSYGIGYEAYKEKVKEDIEKVRDKVDILIVAMHWGVEYTHTPTWYQEDAAKYLASLGVDIIIGTHPHVIMPVTWIDDTLVIYSLGNFLSAQETVEDYNTTVGLLSSVNIEKKVNGSESKIKLKEVNNELIYTYHDGSNYEVLPFSNPLIKTYLKDYKRIYDKYSSVVKNKVATMKVASLAN